MGSSRSFRLFSGHMLVFLNSHDGMSRMISATSPHRAGTNALFGPPRASAMIRPAQRSAVIGDNPGGVLSIPALRNCAVSTNPGLMVITSTP